ncbi:MAG TPA: ABC transporter substrate-binding protein [Variovorax sp.]|nr:ABC transporter substrate-binding protein [Variovorax sp.]
MNWRAVLLVSLWSLSGVAGAAGLMDDRGVELRLARPPQRIVSLLPSLTESVCALKACDRLVGVDNFSNWPASVQTLPHVGGLEDANVERIVALKPDLVLLAKSARVTERLEGLGIPVLALEPKSMKDVERVLGKLGQALGRESEARALWQQLDAGVNRIAASLPRELRGTRVYFEVNNGPYAASESSFIGETLARLGVANIVPAALGPFPKLNPEFVVRANPQLIMIGDRNALAMAQRPGWDAIDAVRARRICIFTAAEGDVLVRPGPRMAEAAELMAGCLKEKLR